VGDRGGGRKAFRGMYCKVLGERGCGGPKDQEEQGQEWGEVSHENRKQ